MIRPGRRFLASTAFATLVAISAGTSLAQAFPVRPIKVVTGVAAGSSPDGVMRQVAQALGAAVGQPVIVENRPGANGIVALESVKTAAPDGYTIAMVSFSQMSVNPSLFASIPHDPVQDFAHIGIFWRGPQLLSASVNVRVASLGEAFTMARARPGHLRYGSGGNGSPGHLFMEQLKLSAGIDAQHIPYKGTTVLVAGLNGEVDLVIDGVSPQMPHVRSGKLKPLAVSGSQRLGVLPDVPTFGESGIAGIGTVWLGFVAPRGTPAAIVTRLNQELRRAVDSSAFRSMSEGFGRLVTPGSPEAMIETILEEIPRWREVVQRARIKPD